MKIDFFSIVLVLLHMPTEVVDTVDIECGLNQHNLTSSPVPLFPIGIAPPLMSRTSINRSVSGVFYARSPS